MEDWGGSEKRESERQESGNNEQGTESGWEEVEIVRRGEQMGDRGRRGEKDEK